MAALTTRAAALSLAAGVSLIGSAAVLPGLASAAPSDLSVGNCTPTTSPLVTCPSPKLRIGASVVAIGGNLTFEVSNFLAQSKYKVKGDQRLLLSGRDTSGLADTTGDDKRGIGTGAGKNHFLTLPLNINLSDSAHVDPATQDISLTVYGITNDAGKPATALSITYKITKATDKKTIKTLELAAASAKKKGEGAVELGFLVNIASSKRSTSVKAEIKRLEKNKVTPAGPHISGLSTPKIAGLPASAGSATVGTVLAAAAAKPAAPSGGLAFTGAEIAGMSLVGAGLLGTGAFLIVAGRRRKVTAS